MSNRADRRRAQRNAQKEEQLAKQAAARQFEKDVKRDGVFDAKAAWQNPHYMREVIAMRKSERDGWNRNGITKANLDREYQRGYKAAQKEMAAFYGKYFFASVAVALHRDFKFGKERIRRVLDAMYEIITWEITTCDILKRCLDETGIEIRFEDIGGI